MSKVSITAGYALTMVCLLLLLTPERYNVLAIPQVAVVVDIAELTINSRTGDREYDNKPFTGEARSYFADGRLERAEQYVAGRRHGYLRMWHENSQPAFESNYRAGRREGSTTSWWSNGNTRTRTEYLDDKPHGVAWSWYRGGEKFKRYNYVAGEPAGLQQGWRTNGKLFSNFEYRNGRTYGLRNANLCVELEDEDFVFN